MTRLIRSCGRVSAIVVVLLMLLPPAANAQWAGSGQATVDAFSCGGSRYVDGVFQQDFHLETTVIPTGQEPSYYPAISPVQINTGFYFTTTTPVVLTTYNGTVTLTYTAGVGFGYGNPAPGSTVWYFVSAGIMDASTGGLAGPVSYREAFCVVPAQEVPTPTPTDTPMPTATDTPTPTPTNTPLPTPTDTPTPTPTTVPPTATDTPTPTPTTVPPTATDTPTPTPTTVPPTATDTPTPTPTSSSTVTVTPTPTDTPTVTVTATSTATVTVTPSPTAGGTVPATSTTQPVVSPTTTVETSTSVLGQTTVIVRIAMPNGENVTGAPWDLYAAAASQAAIEPYRSGIVGPNNTIELADLPLGNYRLVVRPEGMNPVELMLKVTGESRELLLQVPDPVTGSVTGAVAQGMQPQTTTPTSIPGQTATGEPTVAAFPNTGTGGAGMMPMTVLISAACIVTLMFSAFVLRCSDD